MSKLTSAMCSDAPIGLGHGGGSSSYYQLRALQAKTDIKQLVTVPDHPDGHYPNNPFWHDYLAAATVEQQVDVVMFNGSPWGITQKMLNAGLNIADCPAHRLAESIRECEKGGMKYPFMHQYDDFLWPLYSQHIRAADVVIVQAQQSIAWLDELGVKPQRAVVIPGGCIPPETVAPYPSGEFRVAYCGALGWDKGVSYLIDAWLKLNYQDGSKLVLAGAGTEQAQASLKGYPSIECLGRMPSLDSVYDSCSVYVQPSVTEGFGLTVLEVMAHGRPVIVSVGAGVHELIEDGVDGIKVGVRDIKGIADAIDHLRRNPDKAAAMGRAARQKAMQWTWDRAQASYEALIV